MRVSRGQVAELCLLLERGEIDRKTLDRFLKNHRLLRNPMCFAQDIGPFGWVYDSTVNYRTFKAMKSGARQEYSDMAKYHFGRIEDFIDDHFFQRRGVRQVKFELYEFDVPMTADQAARKIQDDGYQIEGLPELLAFAAAFPKEQLRRPILQVRDRIEHTKNLVELMGLGWKGDDARPVLDIFYPDTRFGPDFRFLVSKQGLAMSEVVLEQPKPSSSILGLLPKGE